MKTYKVLYTTSADDFKEVEETIIPTLDAIDFMNVKKELGKNINESYVVNTNLAKITRLFTENAVSQEERVNIVNRFANEAKTVEQSKALYESINNELKNSNKNLTLEHKVETVENKQLNEVKKSKGLLDTLDLIKRMGM